MPFMSPYADTYEQIGRLALAFQSKTTGTKKSTIHRIRMNKPCLSLEAKSSQELLALLTQTDIDVPLETEGRTTQHREKYMMARLLATLADSDKLDFPLRVEHREKPDFALYMPNRSIGIECVEAVSDEWKQISAIRDKDFPDKLIFTPRCTPGEKTFTI